MDDRDIEDAGVNSGACLAAAMDRGSPGREIATGPAVTLFLWVVMLGVAMPAGDAAAQGSVRFECTAGFALSGNNDRTLLSQTLQSCQSACREWESCNSVDFGSGGSGVCYLSEATAGSARLVPNPSFTYCEKVRGSECVPVPTRYDCWADRALEGANDRTLSNVRYPRCEQECTAWGPCRSFDYGADVGGVCYLSRKSASSGTGVVTVNDDFVYCEKVPGRSCPQPRVDEPDPFECRDDKALSGANDRTLLQQTAQSCAGGCREWGPCRSFDFGVEQNGICYLSSKSERDGTGRTVDNPRFRYCEKVNRR